MTTLSIFRDLKITDLYVRLDGDSPAIYQGQKRGKSRINAVVPEQYKDDIKTIANFVKNHEIGGDGIVHLEGMRMRMSRQNMADGEDWMCLRVIKTQIPPIEKLGIIPGYLQALRDLGQRDGLVMITGATGHGKTTTAVALLIEYLVKFGGIAVTIEDPVEYVLKGHHGEKGFCFQVEVESDEEWADNIKKALRWAPHYIFVGEIRTAKAAEQVLRAATTGHMVITTVHAGSPEEALMGFMHMAEQAMGGGSSQILAAGITAVVHQTMTDVGPNIRMCVSEPHNMGDPLRACIRENRVGMITTYIDKMAARLGSAK